MIKLSNNLNLDENSSTNIGTINAFILDPSDIPCIWDTIVPFLDKALQYAEGELLSEDILPHLESGDMRLWIAVEKGDVIAAMVTEIVAYPRKRIVRIITLASDTGHGMKLWYDFLPLVEGYALSNSCTALEAWGRKGLVRRLPDWKNSYQVITKDIKQRLQ